MDSGLNNGGDRKRRKKVSLCRKRCSALNSEFVAVKLQNASGMWPQTSCTCGAVSGQLRIVPVTACRVLLQLREF